MSESKTNKRITDSKTSLLVYKGNIPEAENHDKEAMFNLVNFVETLIQMDRQHQEWLKINKHDTEVLSEK